MGAVRSSNAEHHLLRDLTTRTVSLNEIDWKARALPDPFALQASSTVLREVQSAQKSKEQNLANNRPLVPTGGLCVDCVAIVERETPLVSTRVTTALRASAARPSPGSTPPAPPAR